MSPLLTMFSRIINPKSDLSRVPHSPSSANPTPPAGTTEDVRAHRYLTRDVFSNVPLMLGALIVVALFLVVLFGPLWAPENPYLAGQRTLSYVDGELVSPPFPPSEEYPLGTNEWGKDTLSLLLYGARNTLVACTFITMARLILGLILGAMAGWNEGGLIDRTIMGSIGLTTALPTLITSMIIIYALDIRRGLPVFIVGLSLIGWGEIAQYIRSEFMILKTRPFVEGARAMGLQGIHIAVRHILPNILPQLIVITLLEMGAVLMILGELGFVGVFIGGGTRTTSAADATVIIPDIPEWGAMMADARRWARAKPWMVFYPALAFFLAVVGFNSLGEGLRQLSERAGISTAFLLRKRMVLIIAVITAATIFIINNVGPAPSYARLAQQFDANQAYEFVEILADKNGRGNGQSEVGEVAEFIAARFKAYGMQPAGDAKTYFRKYPTQLVQSLEQPALSLLDEAGDTLVEFRHQLDFGFVIDGHGGSGLAEGLIVFIGFDSQNKRVSWEDYADLDLRGRIVLLLEGNAPGEFPTEALIRGAAGVLWVTSDAPEAVRSQIQLAHTSSDYLCKPTLPIFRVRPAVANAILEPAGLSLNALQGQLAEWPAGDRPWLAQDVESQVRMALQLGEPEDVDLINVVGFWPGQDIALDEELIIVSAHYDGLGQDPDGTIFPAANDNATGVATLLEIGRLWHEHDLSPRRTMLFVVWMGGDLDYSGAQQQFEIIPTGLPYLQPVAIFQLDNLGAGGDTLQINPQSTRLADLMESAAEQIGIPMERTQTVYHGYQGYLSSRAPSVLFSWTDSYVEPDQDTLKRIDAEKLGLAGEVLNLALINVSRQPSY